MRRAASACAPRLAFKRSEDEFLLRPFQQRGQVKRVRRRDGERVGMKAVTIAGYRFFLRQRQVVSSDLEVAGPNVGTLHQVLGLAKISWASKDVS
jgi:hypothetical protein